MFSVLFLSLSPTISSLVDDNSSHPSARITIRHSNRPSAIVKERNKASIRAIEGWEGMGEVYNKNNEDLDWLC